MSITLGQRVTVTDYLVRASLTSDQAISLSDIWDEMPEGVVKQARKASSPSSVYRHYRVWAPASIVNTYPSNHHFGYVSNGTREHPRLYPGSVDLPVTGVIVQQVLVQDGMPEYGEYGSGFSRMSTRVGYKVAYHLTRRPLLVLPSMIETGDQT